MIRRNVSTPETRAFWADAERAAKRAAQLPPWKLGVLTPKERKEDMTSERRLGDYCPSGGVGPAARITANVVNVSSASTTPDAENKRDLRAIAHAIASGHRHGDEVLIAGTWYTCNAVVYITPVDQNGATFALQPDTLAATIEDVR